MASSKATPLKGKRVSITSHEHRRWGLTGYIVAGWNAFTGSVWVRLDGQPIETVCAPWQMELL